MSHTIMETNMTVKGRRNGHIREREVTEPISTETYKANWIPVRPGAQDHEQVPSRMGDRRVYRDGREEVVA